MRTPSGRRPRPQTEIRFPIEARKDKYGKTYYLGWTDAPAQLDLNNCAFFIFVGDSPEVCIRKRQDIVRDNNVKRERTRDEPAYTATPGPEPDTASAPEVEPELNDTFEDDDDRDYGAPEDREDYPEDEIER